MMTEPTREHKWLQQLVGDWTFEHSPCEPGQPKPTGTETIRSIGGLWIQAEGNGKMPDGQAFTMMLTLGYDPQKKRFVGTWVGSMMANLWVYEGELDAAGKTLTLNTEGPKMTPQGLGEGTTRYREVIEIKSDDLRIFSSYMLGDDDKWVEIMTAEYRRKQ